LPAHDCSCCSGSFPPAWSQPAQFAWLIGISTLLWCAQGCLAIPLNAFVCELTDDYHERTRIGAICGAFKVLPQLVTGWIYWLALQPFWGGEINGVRGVSVGVAVLFVAAVLVPAAFGRERFAHRAVESTGLRNGTRQAFKSRPFLHLLTIRVIITLGVYIFTGMLFCLVTFHVCGGDT